MLTKKDIEALDKLASNATPRPWKRSTSGIYPDRLGIKYTLFHTFGTLGDRHMEIDNEEFVIALANVWPELKEMALSQIANNESSS